jgi:hypothetical protein
MLRCERMSASTIEPKTCNNNLGCELGFCLRRLGQFALVAKGRVLGTIVFAVVQENGQLNSEKEN